MSQASTIFTEEPTSQPVLVAEEKEKENKYQMLMDRLRNKEERLSYSSLKAFAKSPREFINYKLKPKTPPNEGQILGSLCDFYLTTPDEDFNKKFAIIDKAPTSDNQKGFVQDMLDGKSKQEAFDRNYKRGNANEVYDSMSEYIEGHLSGKTICTSSQIDEAEKIVENLKKSDLVMEYVNSCHLFQNKLDWTMDGWNFSGYTDAQGEGLIVDFKYAGKGSDPDKFEREIINMKYYLQMALYANAIEYDGMPECVFIVYDRSLNFSVIKVDYSLIKYGEREYKYLLSMFDKCIRENKFHHSYNYFDHSSSVRTMFKPGWMKGFDAETEEI